MFTSYTHEYFTLMQTDAPGQRCFASGYCSFEDSHIKVLIARHPPEPTNAVNWHLSRFGTFLAVLNNVMMFIAAFRSFFIKGDFIFAANFMLLTKKCYNLKY